MRMLYVMDAPSFHPRRSGRLSWCLVSETPPPLDSPSYIESNFLVSAPTSILYRGPYPQFDNSLPLRNMALGVSPLQHIGVAATRHA